LDDSINHRHDGGEMNVFGVVGTCAKAAVKIPEINTFGQRYPPLAFDVFADLVFGGFEHAVTVFTFDVQIERFFHNCLYFGAISPGGVIRNAPIMRLSPQRRHIGPQQLKLAAPGPLFCWFRTP
jgi:hypothetical protein